MIITGIPNFISLKNTQNFGTRYVVYTEHNKKYFQNEIQRLKQEIARKTFVVSNELALIQKLEKEKKEKEAILQQIEETGFCSRQFT